MSYLHGLVYYSGYRVSELNVLAIEYDGSIVGSAMAAAYGRLEGGDFPTLHFAPASQFPTVKDLRDSVCRGDY